MWQDTRETVSDTVGGVTFRYTAGEFFQNNAYALPLMVHHVVTQAKAPLPQTNAAPRYLVDAYCGGGLFCLSAAKHFEVRGFINQQEAAGLFPQDSVVCVAAMEHL